MKFSNLTISTFFSFILIAIIVSGCTQKEVENGTGSVLTWMKEHARPIKTIDPNSSNEDLSPLIDIVGNARVVCLGDSRHDAHEQYVLKHRIIRFLVEEMGFSLLALEESFPDSDVINDFILKGDGDPEDALNKMGAWYIWNTEEIVALVEWMRDYNGDPNTGRKIKFYGIDITNPLPALQSTLSYLEQVDKEYFVTMNGERAGLDLFRARFWGQIMQKYYSIPPRDVDSLTNLYDGMLSRFQNKRAEYIKNSSQQRFEWINQQLVTVRQAHELFTKGVRATFQEAGDVREKAMVDNIKWILNHNTDRRLIVWAHNFHVARDSLDLNIPNRPPTKGMVPMAHYLSNEIGEDVVTIGFSFYESDYREPLPPTQTDMIDAYFSRVGHSIFMIDLRSAPKDGPVYEWLNRKQKMRGEGGVAEFVPANAYDAFIFIRKITHTIPTQSAILRFETLQ
ncbi:MAG: erythromycin esterase family protein [bacterium]|nr:MAG: erythromycin esterase family protein [bacterium]